MRILIFILSLMTLTEAGAQHRFSKFYNNNIAPDKNYDTAVDFWEMPDSGLLFPTISKAIFQVDTLGYAVTYFQVIRTKANGDTIWTRNYRKPKFSITVKLIAPMNDGNFLLVGHAFDLVKYDRDSTGAELMLIKINPQGDTLWTKTLGIGDGDELEVKLINTHDKGFAILGQTCDKAETNCDLFIMKLDSNANKQWHKVLTWDVGYWEQPDDIIETLDHEFLLCSATENIKTKIYYGYIVKTDSVGNTLWQKKLDNEGNNYGYILSIALGTNKSYLFGGVIGYKDKDPDLENIKGWLIRTDTSGNYLMNKKIGEENKSTGIFYVKEKNNSIFIEGHSTAYNFEKNGRTFLFKLDSVGNSIWRRIYQDSLIANRTYVSYCTKQTLDGGFAMIGFGTDPKDSTPNQDVWLLKVDSNGCLYNNCLSVGMQEYELTKHLSLKIYPNPAHTQFQLESSFKIASIQLLNSIGKVVRNYASYEKEAIDVANLASGIYLLKARTENNEIVMERLMVE